MQLLGLHLLVPFYVCRLCCYCSTTQFPYVKRQKQAASWHLHELLPVTSEPYVPSMS